MISSRFFKIVLPLIIVTGICYAASIDPLPEFNDDTLPVHIENMRRLNSDLMDALEDASLNAATIVVNEASIEVLEARNYVVQIVNTQTGAVDTGSVKIPWDDTKPQNDEGDEYMTLAITPTSATNKLKIEVVWNGTHNVQGYFTVALFQDDTADALATAPTIPASASYPTNVKFTYYMTAGTTSETTFKVRAGSNDAGTTTFNGRVAGRIHGGVMTSSITITEYSQ